MYGVCIQNNQGVTSGTGFSISLSQDRESCSPSIRLQTVLILNKPFSVLQRKEIIRLQEFGVIVDLHVVVVIGFFSFRSVVLFVFFVDNKFYKKRFAVLFCRRSFLGVTNNFQVQFSGKVLRQALVPLYLCSRLTDMFFIFTEPSTHECMYAFTGFEWP